MPLKVMLSIKYRHLMELVNLRRISSNSHIKPESKTNVEQLSCATAKKAALSHVEWEHRKMLPDVKEASVNVKQKTKRKRPGQEDSMPAAERQKEAKKNRAQRRGVTLANTSIGPKKLPTIDEVIKEEYLDECTRDV